jgi:hypothetical protein
LGQRRTQGPSMSHNPWKRHISLNMCLIGKPKNLSASVQKQNEDRVVTSILKLDLGNNRSVKVHGLVYMEQSKA